MNNDLHSQINDIIADPELREQLKRLVIERLNVMLDTLRMAIGSENFTKEDLLERVGEEDEIGNQVMELDPF